MKNTKENRLKWRQANIDHAIEKHGAIVRKEAGLTALIYTDGKPTATIWAGTAYKPYANYCFSSEEKRDEYVSNQFAREAERNEAKEAEKTRKKAFKTSFKVGDILYSSWGYDQTNIDFYQVTEVSKTGKTIKIRKIKSKTVETVAWAQERVVACPDEFCGGEMRKVVQSYGENSEYVSIASYASARKWDGSPCLETSYA